MADRTLLTVKQAAERATVSESLVYAWCNTGVLPHVRLGRSGKRGTIRIDESDLEALLQTLKVTAGPNPIGEQYTYLKK